MGNVGSFVRPWPAAAAAPLLCALFLNSCAGPSHPEPPSSISRFPADLANSQLALSGIYEDGWTAQNASLSLRQPAGEQFLVVRGMVPQIDRAGFRTSLEVQVDQRTLTTQSLGPGDFTIYSRMSNHPGVRRVSLSYRDGQKLPAGDGRVVGARLSFVGFERQPVEHPAASDVVDPGSGVRLGSGWDVLETYRNETFRWVKNDAQILIAPGKPGIRRLSMTIEPGPGLNGSAFVLRVLDSSGRQVDAAEVRQRETVQMFLPVEGAGENAYRLHVDNEGKPAPGKDPRILNFRVFRIDPN